jgi:acetyl/propionyl-CoA carboxylase alpha subunit
MGFKVSLDGQAHDIEIVGRRPRLIVRVDGREHDIGAFGDLESERNTIEISGSPVSYARGRTADRQFLRLDGRTFEARAVDPRARAEGAGEELDHVKAPMPGAVVAIHAEVGALVARGDALVTIESMKLQMALLAPRDGRIARLARALGDRFEKDEVIVELEPVKDGG